jgi:hypothetical protein
MASNGMRTELVEGISFNSALPLFMGALWVVAGVVCASGMKAYTSSTPASSTRARSISLLGLLVTFLGAFTIAVTRFVPIAILLIPAPVVFAVLIFRPTLAQKRFALRTYLMACVILSVVTFSIELIWLLRK